MNIPIHIIKKALNEKGYTQKEISRLTGIPQPTISKALTNKPEYRNLQKQCLPKICKQLISENNGSQIFISYCINDKDQVEDIYDLLTLFGCNPWMDKRDIPPGDRWEKNTKKAISNSDFFMVCLSKNSVSKRGFLQKEIRYALDKLDEMPDEDIYLIPVQLEECDVPEDLQDFQWVNLYEDDGWDRLFKAIQAGIVRRQAKGHKKEQCNDKDTHPSHQTPEKGDYKKPSQKNIRDLKGTDIEDSEQYGGSKNGNGYLRKILALSKSCQYKFEEAEKLAYGIFKDPEDRYVPLPFFTPHGTLHCQAVEDFLNEILSAGSDPNKDFIPNPEEAMYLLSVAWIHDIGMMYGVFPGEQAGDLTNNPDFWAKLREDHEIRTTRHILHEWHLKCNWSNEEKAILANVCHYHRKKHKIEEFAPNVIKGHITGESVRIKVIAALLRITDACHVDKSRVPGKLRALYDSLGMPPEEVCFWGKQELVSRVRFQHPDGKIIIESLVPDPFDFKRGKFDFEEIIELVRKDIEEELVSIQTVLLPYTNTAFKEVTKEVNILPALDVEAPKRCLGVWPYFLKKPYSATEGAASLAQMLLFEIAETQNFGDPWRMRIRGMIREVIRWRPYDVVVFKLQNEINEILSQKQAGSPVQDRLNVYLREFLVNISRHSNKMAEKAIHLVQPEDVLFLYGYSINIVKFLQAIKRSHSGAVYVVDSRSSNAHLQFDPHENEQVIAFLEENGFKVHSIRLIELSQILDDLGRTKTPRKIILGTHSVLRQNDSDYNLLCEKGCKALCLIGRDGGAEIMAFAETNKFIDIEKKEDIKSVAVQGFLCRQENGSVGVASGQERLGIRMDVIPKSVIDYLITEKGIY